MLLEFLQEFSSSSLLLYLKIQSDWQRLWDLHLGFQDEFQNSLSLEKPFLNLSPMENQAPRGVDHNGHMMVLDGQGGNACIHAQGAALTFIA